MLPIARFALSCLLLSLGALAPALAGEDTPHTLRADGLERSYLVHTPPGNADSPHPLLLVFHGGGSVARGMPRFTHLDGIADRAGMIVVYPQGVDRHWNDGRDSIKRKVDDVGFVRALLDAMERDFAVDRSRIYAAGISNGAIFVERLACDMSGRIAGIATVAGTLARDYQPQCQPQYPVSVVQFDGTADPIVPYAGGEVTSFGGHGEGGQVLAVDATAAFWARMDGCAAADAPVPLPPQAPLDPTRVFRSQWGPCRGGRAVVLYSIQEGGHTWPGGPQYLPKFIVGRASRQIDASETMVRFFLDHPRADSLARVMPTPPLPRLAGN
ncbi:PHB depolymerase family esterase [Rhodanobacter sp. DHB23]|uniref:extracellular catalytic domain type 1 short-chain-length polyhydroxyalkanoate depolymerase n=1 Tax=Rhodanobacter sp. DHB23 TaxID=2775923 RepID=UPI00177C847D|nr:PHB depolymerase family esterase [Rhodanobacter sp. DHB23]MBD8873049.1 esterase [Rhodanobacter sp. DHB23]